MTVTIDDTTKYESQDNGLYKEDISSKHPVLPWLVSNAAGQTMRGHIGADGLRPHQRLKGRALRKLLSVFAESVLYLPIGKRASLSRNAGAMDCSSGSSRGARNSTLAPCLVSCELEV